MSAGADLIHPKNRDISEQHLKCAQTAHEHNKQKANYECGKPNSDYCGNSLSVFFDRNYLFKESIHCYISPYYLI